MFILGKEAIEMHTHRHISTCISVSSLIAWYTLPQDHRCQSFLLKSPRQCEEYLMCDLKTRLPFQGPLQVQRDNWCSCMHTFISSVSYLSSCTHTQYMSTGCRFESHPRQCIIHVHVHVRIQHHNLSQTAPHSWSKRVQHTIQNRPWTSI